MSQPCLASRKRELPEISETPTARAIMTITDRPSRLAFRRARLPAAELSSRGTAAAARDGNIPVPAARSP